MVELELFGHCLHGFVVESLQPQSQTTTTLEGAGTGTGSHCHCYHCLEYARPYASSCRTELGKVSHKCCKSVVSLQYVFFCGFADNLQHEMTSHKNRNYTLFLLYVSFDERLSCTCVRSPCHKTHTDDL